MSGALPEPTLEGKGLRASAALPEVGCGREEGRRGSPAAGACQMEVKGPQGPTGGAWQHGGGWGMGPAQRLGIPVGTDQA